MANKQKNPVKRAGVSRVVEWRLSRIISIIAGGAYPNCKTLAKEIEGVSAKTIQRDISHLINDRGLPLEYDEVRHGYGFTKPVSEFAPVQLTRGEVVALFVAQKALEPLRGTRLQRVVSDSVNKIAAACPEAVTIHWKDLDEAFSVKASGVLPADVELFNNLLDASMNGKEVEFNYCKLKGSGQEARRLQPYHVGQFEHGWYVIGFDLDRQSIRMFALQRLSNLKATKRRFKKPADFDARKHLSGGFGVWGYGSDAAASYEVEIEFSDWAARVVAERLWHATQEIEECHDQVPRILFRASVAGLEEITRWVLSWGSKAKVLGPPALKKRVKDELKAMAAAM